MLKKVLLKDIENLNIIGGQITSRIEAKLDSNKIGEIKVLTPKAIQNGSCNHKDLGLLNISQEADSKKVTKLGDIVIKLSTPYDACIIKEEDERLLVPSFCAIINNIPDYISKDYLLAFLNSKVYQNQIKNLLIGQNLPILSIGQIKKVELPLPSIDVQEDIGNTYKGTLDKIKLLEKIISLESEYLESRFYELEEK